MNFNFKWPRQIYSLGALCVSLILTSCAHGSNTEEMPDSNLEIVAERVLLEKAGADHFRSVSCLDLICTFEYGAFGEQEAAEVARAGEAALALEGFPEVKIEVKETFSASLMRAVLFGLGMGLAAAVFGSM